MSDSSSTLPKFDVFLSFRGLDTRRNFISFLYRELIRRNIRTFKDDKELKNGRRISPELIRAIEGSRFAVVVVSVNYAASRWCLEELVKIMDFENMGSLKVMPIFYGVDPCHVRRQIGEVAEQFKKHEGREDHEKVLSWRQALTNLASISGDCSWKWEDDSKMVEEITDRISKELMIDTRRWSKKMTPSLSLIPKFDVFLSFKAEDTTNVFVSDLHRSLSEKGITTYQKDENLEEKDSSVVSDDLKKGIIKSKLAVVVVSKSYPTSVLCLNQLQTIINFHDEGQLSVLPIFYGVDLPNIRNQTGEYKEAFRSLGEEFSTEKVQAWRSALSKLTSVPSLDSRFWSKEAKMVDLVTNEILLMVSNKPNSPSTTKGDGHVTHVALDRHMQALYELLDLKFNKEVRLVGLWGPGGVGKTTLARYAYEELSTNFHVRMFVDNIEKIHHQDNRETFTSKEIKEGFQKLTRGPTVRSDVIKSTVAHRKGLLVVDCVDNIEQLKDIAKIVRWCGSGSRIILIAQDKNLLDKFGVDHVYEVQSLRYDEALQIFSQSAFKQQHPPTSFESLSLRAIQIASFLPLTLQILGSFLQGKDEKSWEEVLHKLEGDQEKTIMKVMKESYIIESEKDQISSFIFSSDE